MYQNDQQKHWLTVNQTAEKYPAFSHSSLRYWLFHGDKNGLNKAITRVGKKVLIRQDLFEEWLESQQEGGQK